MTNLVTIFSLLRVGFSAQSLFYAMVFVESRMYEIIKTKIYKTIFYDRQADQVIKV